MAIFIRKLLEVYARDGPALNNAGNIIDFPAKSNNSISLKLKKITGQTENERTKDVEIMVALKYLSSFSRTLEMLLVSCEINLVITWSPIFLMAAGTVANEVPIFAITDTKLYVLAVTLSTQDNAKLLK